MVPGTAVPAPIEKLGPPLIAAITSTRDTGANRASSSRSLPVDVEVDVRPDRRPGLAETVAQTRIALLQPLDRLDDSAGVDVELPRQVGEERRQRSREVDVRHHSITVACTDEIGGR